MTQAAGAACMIAAAAKLKTFATVSAVAGTWGGNSGGGAISITPSSGDLLAGDTLFVLDPRGSTSLPDALGSPWTSEFTEMLDGASIDVSFRLSWYTLPSDVASYSVPAITGARRIVGALRGLDPTNPIKAYSTAKGDTGPQILPSLTWGTDSDGIQRDKPVLAGYKRTGSGSHPTVAGLTSLRLQNAGSAEAHALLSAVISSFAEIQLNTTATNTWIGYAVALNPKEL